MSNLNRDLNGLESAFSAMNKTQPFVVVMCAHIQGDLSQDILDEALEVMRRRHDYLSFFIDEGRDGSRWIHDAGARIPVERIEATSETQWVDTCNTEMNVAFDTSRAPLARVIYIQRADGVDLVFKFSHIISDGLSVRHFVRELLMVIGGLCRDEKVELPPLPKGVYPDPRHFPDEPAGAAEAYQPLRLSGTLLERHPYRPIEDRRTHIIPCWLDAEQTSAIMASCKEHGVTVNALLASALLVGIKGHVVRTTGATDEFTIKISSAVNMRPYYRSCPREEHLGCWAGFGYAWFGSGEVTSPWACAGAFQSRLAQCIDQGRPFSHWKSMMHAYSARPAGPGVDGDVPYVILSNLGKLRMDERYGDRIRLERISAMTPMHRHWPNDLSFGVFANTLNGRLNLIFHYMAPGRTPAEAADLAGGITRLILGENV